MFTIFFKSTGPVIIDCMDKDKSIDSKHYIENCLKRAIAEVGRQRPAFGATNLKSCKPHIAKSAKSCLGSEGLTIIDHPLYSPDLAPCNFRLFDRIKPHLDDHGSEKRLKRHLIKETPLNFPKVSIIEPSRNNLSKEK